MKKQLLQNKYPILSFEILKKNCKYQNTKSILKVLKTKIDDHQVAQFITFFNHISHTKNLKDGFIHPEILESQIIIFCFGKELKNPLQLSVRPRTIGVAETMDKFIFSYLEAPNPVFNTVMEQWIKSLQKNPKTPDSLCL